MKTRLPINRRFVMFEALLLALVLLLTGVGSRLRADTGTCNGQTFNLPFTDVMGNSAFCFIAEVFFLGITSGTTPTTYSPSANVTRDQMAIFLARTHDSAVKRSSRRAALDQFWTTKPHYDFGMAVTPVGAAPAALKSDGADIWVASLGDTVTRVSASDGAVKQTWTGATDASAVLVAMGRVLVAGGATPGSLYMIDPSQPPGIVTTVTTTNPLGHHPSDIAFDGERIWLAHPGFGGTAAISIITPGASFPWASTTFSPPGLANPQGLVFDGANMWVANGINPSGSIKKLDAGGAVIQTVSTGSNSRFPCFDGTNIWVPNNGTHNVTVVRAATGTILANLSGNGLNTPRSAAFDGERILITNDADASVPDAVVLFRAADFAPLGSFPTGAGASPTAACSDGVNFWLTLQGTGGSRLARF